MIFQAHKGVSYEAPENTFPAFAAAVAQGYGIIELDLGVTADGVFVVLHDSTLNRTARTADGGRLDGRVCISDISYEQASGYDYGIWFSEKYRGTALPRLEEVLAFAEENGIKLKIDNKYQAFTPEQRSRLFALLAPYQGLAELTCGTLDAVLEAARAFPEMHIHYDGAVDEGVLSALAVELERERLTVWLPLRCKQTEWVKLPFATEESARLVKGFARLGLWLLSDYTQLEAAKRLGADVVETNGSIKPPLRSGIVADMHTHSENSHDSSCKVEAMLSAQREKGTAIFALTDHCDIYSCNSYDIFTPLIRGYETVAALNGAQGDVRLLSGVEISEGFWLPEQMEKANALVPYDVIVGSVHCVKYEGLTRAYSAIDFSALSDETVAAYLDAYFDDVARLTETTDFDILAHLTCPLRYISGKYGRQIDLTAYNEKLTAILKAIIKKGIALEVNTSSFDVLGDYFPSKALIESYYALGGYLITLGSDAHVSERASAHFADALDTLRQIGFKHIYYCKKRIFYQCAI